MESQSGHKLSARRWVNSTVSALRREVTQAVTAQSLFKCAASLLLFSLPCRRNSAGGTSNSCARWRARQKLPDDLQLGLFWETASRWNVLLQGRWAGWQCWEAERAASFPVKQSTSTLERFFCLLVALIHEGLQLSVHFSNGDDLKNPPRCAESFDHFYTDLFCKREVAV